MKGHSRLPETKGESDKLFSGLFCKQETSGRPIFHFFPNTIYDRVNGIVIAQFHHDNKLSTLLNLKKRTAETGFKC